MNGWSLKDALWNLQGGICLYCARKMVKEYGFPNTATREHLHPKDHGGKNFENIVLVCYVCNQERDTKPLNPDIKVAAREIAKRAHKICG